jgi:hypothetical protein
MRLLEVYRRLHPSDGGEKVLAVPRVVTILKSCVRHRIQDALIGRLHFNDLYVLLLGLDIAELREAIKQARRQKDKERGVGEVEILSPTQAAKFLKGG